MIKTYQSFDEIDRDLKRLSLERQIAIEELKMVKSDFEKALRPISILNSVFGFVRKYGILLLIKKMFR
tara:strand:+ start:507 stop:710 length:204 start_codon:yes stop_codon:yes gene_type:complete